MAVFLANGSGQRSLRADLRGARHEIMLISQPRPLRTVHPQRLDA